MSSPSPSTKAVRLSASPPFSCTTGAWCLNASPTLCSMPITVLCVMSSLLYSCFGEHTLSMRLEGGEHIGLKERISLRLWTKVELTHLHERACGLPRIHQRVEKLLDVLFWAPFRSL